MLASVPIADIRINDDRLRGVNQEDVEYQQLADSVQKDGVLHPILLSRMTDSETGEAYYELIDGGQRFQAAQDAGHTEINASIKEDVTKADYLTLQMVANLHRVKTKPIEYSRAIIRLLAEDPMLTLPELAQKLSRSIASIEGYIKLNKIEDKSVQTLINEGNIKLVNAIQLAKLAEVAPNEVSEFLDDAVALTGDQFVPRVSQRIKEVKEEQRKGRPAAPKEFSPKATIRKMGVLTDDAEVARAADTLAPEAPDAFRRGVLWVLQLDSASVEAQKAAYDERQAQALAKKEARDAEREKKKAQREELKKKEAENKVAQSAGLALPHPEVEAARQAAIAEVS